MEPNLSRFRMQIYQFGKWKFSRSEYTRREGIVPDKENSSPIIANHLKMIIEVIMIGKCMHYSIL